MSEAETDSLWAQFRSWLDDIDTNVKTISQVRREMLKVQADGKTLDDRTSPSRPPTLSEPDSIVAETSQKGPTQ